MATIRTMMTPDGDVLTFEVADETYMSPSGSIVNGDITAAAGGGDFIQKIAGPGGIAGEGGTAGKHGGIAG